MNAIDREIEKLKKEIEIDEQNEKLIDDLLNSLPKDLINKDISFRLDVSIKRGNSVVARFASRFAIRIASSGFVLSTGIVKIRVSVMVEIVTIPNNCS